MKKFFRFLTFAIVVLVSLALTSCEKDGTSDGSVVGTWEITYCKFFPEMDEDDIESLVGERITFYEDGTFSDSYDLGKWSKDGDYLTITYEEMDDDEFTLPTVMKITRLTSSVMEVNIDYVFVKCDLKMKKVK